MSLLGRRRCFLRLAESVLQLLVEADVEGLIGAGRHERAADRLNWRNGIPRRTARHAAWHPSPKIPKLRSPRASCFPPFLEARKTTEKGAESPKSSRRAWIGEMSTRRVGEIAQAIGRPAARRSQVSKLAKEIDERVKAFLDRPLEGD